MFNAYKELISAFKTLGPELYDEDALIGLMLLTAQRISNEYSFLSPRKGFLFGSQFYTKLEDILNELGINIKEITIDERKHYYSALAQFMEKNPNLIANEYILDSLSKQANIILPKIPPLLTDNEVKNLLQQEPGKTHVPTALRTSSGLYKMHPVPLDKGGWGSVHAGRNYTLTDAGVTVSSPLAIKKMPMNDQSILDKEGQLFQQAYPDEHFERFNQQRFAYLAMPLFPGMALDKYLSEHQELSRAHRQEIAGALLENLLGIHKRNIIHNDLKPKNILYDPVTRKIHTVDFGCAELHQEKAQFNDMATAKFAIEYMPPEYIQGTHLTIKTDVYSLNLTLAEILGAPKKELVKNRLNKIISKRDDPFKKVLMRAFQDTKSLDDALFSKDVSRFWGRSEFIKFIHEFVNEPYDFTPYSEILGEQSVGLLNRMQNTNPEARPDLEEILEILNSKEGQLENSL